MMTHDEFVEKECRLCGTQRCYGVDYCGKYKKEVLGEEDPIQAVYEIIHTPEKMGAAMKHISELMDKHRAEHPEVYAENVETDKYADLGFGESWVSESPEMPDEDRELAETAQEAYDNLIRSLVEAGGEIRELKEMLREAKDALLYMLVLHDSTHGHNMQEVVQILYHLQSDNRWNVQKAKEALKKISEYCEQEDTE